MIFAQVSLDHDPTIARMTDTCHHTRTYELFELRSSQSQPPK
jgi:hypothetical protein